MSDSAPTTDAADKATPAADQVENPNAADETRPLRNPNFRRLWLNNIGYFLVFNAQRFVFGWFVLDGLNRDEGSQGLVVFALGLPALFLVLQAGAWADRLDRKRLLISTQVAAGLVMVGTGALVAAGQATFTLILVSAALAGATATVGQPVRASLVPALVDRSQLFSAIALNALAMTASMILGPVVANAVGDQFGFEGAFYFQALLLGIGLLFLLRIQIPATIAPAGPRASVTADTLSAVRHITADRSLRALFGLLIVSGFTINPAVMVTLQAFVKEELGQDGGAVAPLFALMGLGLAISSAVVMRKGDMANKGALFQRAMMTGSAMTVLMGRTTDYAQLFPLLFIMGLAGGFYINMNQGLIQANTPQELMGRVMGVYTLIQAGLLPIGALTLGLVARAIGLGNTISIVAALALATVTLVYLRNAELRRLG